MITVISDCNTVVGAGGAEFVLSPEFRGQFTD